MPAKPVFRRAPLMDVSFSPLPLGAIRPDGWIRAQLALQAEAMRVALSARWPDLIDGNAWRAPKESEWPLDVALLAATLPLGHLLSDAPWIEASHKRIEWAMRAQRDDGCLSPAGEDDDAWCARAGLMQVFQQYYMAVADKKVLAHMLRYCKYAWERLKEEPLGLKAAARAGELLQPALWLYRVTEKRFLLELVRVLRAQSEDWTAFCHTMPFKSPISKQLPWEVLRQGMEDAEDDRRRYHTQIYQQTHALNLAMGLKTPALIAQFSGGIKHAEAFHLGYAKLMRYHGFANGLFSGDDLLSGASPSQGTMCGAISELMSTLESLQASSGEASYGDVLEKLAFNALPSAYSADMRAWQRIQQPNQIDLAAPKRCWYNAGAEDAAYTDNLTDMETAALHHGFPRFASSLWMASKDGGLAAISYAPCTVRARVGGGTARFDVRSAYPFDGTVTLCVHTREALAFPLHLRIPSWAEGASVSIGEETQDCRPNAFTVLDRIWRTGDTVTLRLPMRVAFSEWYHRSVALCHGPLLLAYAPEEGKPWAYALLPDQGSHVRCDPTQAAPFGYGLPLVVEGKAVPLPEWQAKGGAAEAPPIAPSADAAQVVTLPLVPYGATATRICQFPTAFIP